MSATSHKRTVETSRNDEASGGRPAASTRASIGTAEPSAHPTYSDPIVDRGTGLILLAALLAAAGVACTATSVTLLLRAARPGRIAPHVIGFAGMTLLASSALCLILLSAR
ncbi:hypothetical protein [Sphingomonas panni]|uniref:hypothetical protein n=1 Tax=Sphingomonas panni TaxID=237612 RepID=UPI001F5B713C|nr:hypothetical protein [Sphingomonas panni]